MPLSKTPTLADLEHALFAHFPRETAEEWDRCGLLVGDPAQEAAKVALALDATSAAVRAAAAAGCNALITHHPVFLDPPFVFKPAASDVADSGAAVYEACRLGVGLINFHTCLDRAVAGHTRLPEMLGYTYLHALEGAAAGRVREQGEPGYGAVCELPGPRRLADVARQCDEVLGGACRYWGDGLKEMARVGVCTGSIGDLGEDALTLGLDAVIAGEVRYHKALDLSARGLAVIELGHDVSERPLIACLRSALLAEGLDRSKIVELRLSPNWRSVRED